MEECPGLFSRRSGHCSDGVRPRNSPEGTTRALRKGRQIARANLLRAGAAYPVHGARGRAGSHRLHCGDAGRGSEMTEQTVSEGGERQSRGTESAAKRATLHRYRVALVLFLVPVALGVTAKEVLPSSSPVFVHGAIERLTVIGDRRCRVSMCGRHRCPVGWGWAWRSRCGHHSPYCRPHSSASSSPCPTRPGMHSRTPGYALVGVGLGGFAVVPAFGIPATVAAQGDLVRRPARPCRAPAWPRSGGPGSRAARRMRHPSLLRPSGPHRWRTPPKRRCSRRPPSG